MMSGLIPARLILRELTDDDLEAMAALLGDGRVMRFYPRRKSRAEAQAWIDANRGLYRDRGFGLWAIVLPETGALIGDCGLTVQQVERVDEIELGYHLTSEHQGHGYASEAAIACRDLARDALGIDRLMAIIHPQIVPPNGRRSGPG